MSNVKMNFLNSPMLLRYLNDMGISSDIARKECKQISIMNECGGRIMTVAFPNISGGCEIRNRHISDYIAPKNISYIRCCSDMVTTCYVFDDFIDYLLFLTIMSMDNGLLDNKSKQDYLVLNSVQVLDKAVEILHKYSCVYCFFDSDTKGSGTISKLALKLGRDKIIDALGTNEKFKSVTAYLVNRLSLFRHMDDQLKRGSRR